MRGKAGVCVVVGILCLASAPSAFGDQASKLYKQGRKAERKGDMAQAYLLYSQAAALAPQKKEYWLKSQAVRSRAAMQSKITPPASSQTDLIAEVGALPDEPDPALTITEKDLRDSRKPLPPKEVSALPGRRDFDLKDEPRRLYEQVSKAFGLDVVFDGDYPASSAKQTFRMTEADYREALRALDAMTSSFVVPLGERLLLVAKDSQQKRSEVEPDVAVVIPIPQTVTVQEAQELARNVEQVMEIKRFGIDSARRLVLLNGPVSKVRPAQRLFEDLLSYRPQVIVDLDFIEISKNDALTYGVTVPTSFPFVPLTTVLHNVPAITSSLSYILLGGGASMFAIGVASAQVAANFNKSTAKTLLHSTMRTVDGMPATFHVGEKYPILTSGYFGPASFSGPGAYTPPPSFQFQDLGLVLKITPRVHGAEDVSLDVEAEFTVLAGQAVNGIPIVSSRKMTTKVRLKENESAVLAGMMSTSEAISISGLAGLANIPGLGALVSQTNKTKMGDMVILTMKPHLISESTDDIVTRTMWVGTDTRLRDLP